MQYIRLHSGTILLVLFPEYFSAHEGKIVWSMANFDFVSCGLKVGDAMPFKNVLGDITQSLKL